MTYQTYCRTDPDNGTPVCGQVQCSGTPVTCTMASDPVPAGPVDTNILQREALVFYPLFRFEPGVPMQTYVMPTTTPASAIITGTFTKSSVTPGRVVAAIQGVNGLFLKHVFQPTDVGTVPTGYVTTPSLPPGSALLHRLLRVRRHRRHQLGPLGGGAVRPLNMKYPGIRVGGRSVGVGRRRLCDGRRLPRWSFSVIGRD